jgi:N-acetyl-gamma-glutamyl-phosphate reductase
MKKRIGIIGATGYTGLELIRILNRHPELELVAAASSKAGQILSEVVPCPFDIPLISIEEAIQADLEAVFCALPHGASMPLVKQFRERGIKVVDLSADFRLKDAVLYQRYYKVEHSAQELLAEAVYGIPEIYRANIAGANLIANPGCYPTTILLALYPLRDCEDIDWNHIIIDSKSGVSGAGRKLENNLLFCEANENFSPYSIGHTHRHLSEIEEQLSHYRGEKVVVTFSPHLLPLNQGMLSTIYVPMKRSVTGKELQQKFFHQYRREPFIKMLPEGKLANIRYVSHTNICCLSLTVVEEKNLLILSSAIDNLIKGASGQAVQNLNLMLGLPETMGLL